jgi:hypothetical protein
MIHSGITCRESLGMAEALVNTIKMSSGYLPDEVRDERQEEAAQRNESP